MAAHRPYFLRDLRFAELMQQLAKTFSSEKNKLEGAWSRGQHSGNTFNFSVSGAGIVRNVANGPHALR